MRVCEPAAHQAMKANDAVWRTLKFIGIQDLGDGDRLELRNCHCTSTLCRALPAVRR